MSRGFRGLLVMAFAAVIGTASIASAWVAQQSPNASRRPQVYNGVRARLPQGPAARVVSVPQEPNARSSEDPPTTEDSKYEPLFVDWGNPRLALLLTGSQQGYIEPCGCTGLANQKGGLARRHSLVRSLENRGWTVISLDAGNQVGRVGKQSEIKFQSTLNGLAQMNYKAVTFGPADLKLSIGDLAAATSSIGDQQTPYCSANASIYGLTPEYRVFTEAGVKIGVTGVLGSDHVKELGQSQVELLSPMEGLRNVVPQLQKERCDFLVLLAHTPLEEARRLARQFPVFDLIVNTGEGGEPTHAPESLPGIKTQIVQTGDKGMHAGVVGIFNDAQRPLRYQRVALSDRFPDSKAMLDLMEAYQTVLKQQGLAGLGVRQIPHSSGDRYVGSAACGECHSKAYEIWKETPHAHGTDSLVNPPERRGLARHFDPECLSCHVTGWNPQKYFPYTSGYVDLEQSKHLHGVGCENCHGPGQRHAAAESGEAEATEQQIEQLRKQLRLPLAQAEEHCRQCHDLDNSPDFDFEQCWPQIEHQGVD